MNEIIEVEGVVTSECLAEGRLYHPYRCVIFLLPSSLNFNVILTRFTPFLWLKIVFQTSTKPLITGAKGWSFLFTGLFVVLDGGVSWTNPEMVALQMLNLHDQAKMSSN